MTLEIPLGRVSEILLDDGWVQVRSAEAVGIGLPIKWPTSLAVQDESGHWTYLPLGSIRALRTRGKILSPEQVRAQETEQREAQEAQFEWQHYAKRETYLKAEAAQEGRCPGPRCGRANLADYPITHYVAEEGLIRCELDSPLKHRYGIPG